MPRLGWVIVIACLAWPARASGQESPAAPPPPVVEEPSPKQASRPETEITVDKATQVAVGIGFGGPIGAAASLRVLHGLGADVREGNDRVKAVCSRSRTAPRGFSSRPTPAREAGSSAWGSAPGRAWTRRISAAPWVGVSLRASLVRTWGSPIGTEPNLTYLGPELDLSILRFNLTLGVLWRLSGHTGASAVFGWGIGFGL